MFFRIFCSALLLAMEHPDWQIREQASREADNVVFALLSDYTGNPEVDSRVAHIKNRYLFWTHNEKWCWHRNKKLWFRYYFFRKANKLLSDDQLRELCVQDTDLRVDLISFFDGESMMFLVPPITPEDHEKWKQFLSQKRRLFGVSP